jgi:hypothetical protein
LLRSLVTADFDYCNLLDDHSRIVDLLQKGRVKQALELIDAHYRAVVRSYIMDQAVFPEFTLREALSASPAIEPVVADGSKPAERTGAGALRPGRAKAGRRRDTASVKGRRAGGYKR